jgi:hypothetical protein
VAGRDVLIILATFSQLSPALLFSTFPTSDFRPPSSALDFPFLIEASGGQRKSENASDPLDTDPSKML